MSYTLILGNKTYSSWSLRGWLLFEPFGIAFEHRVVPLHTAAFTAFQRDNFPARQVPTLIVERDGRTTTIWDSLSIAEYLHERHPDAGIWPGAGDARAEARSLCAEMHAGFMALRRTMPMNIRRRYKTFAPDAEASADIERVCALWRWTRERRGAGGPFLFGERFTAADAFYAPVASRFRTYDVTLDASSAAYVDAVLSHPATEAFYRDAGAESWVLEHNEMAID